jgi:FKBP-type peptidyl-prolyl cis-trans isomerase SlyD
MEITEQCVVALTWTLKDTLGEELDVLDEPVESRPSWRKA